MQKKTHTNTINKKESERDEEEKQRVDRYNDREVYKHIQNDGQTRNKLPNNIMRSLMICTPNTILFG
jgi:hypothetical protein